MNLSIDFDWSTLFAGLVLFAMYLLAGRRRGVLHRRMASMKLEMLPGAWKREYLRPEGAIQIGKAYIDGKTPIEIWLRLPTQHHVMWMGWQEQARRVAERKLNADPVREGQVIPLELDEVLAG